MPSTCNFDYYSPVVFLYWQYMFCPNQPSSAVPVVVVKESTAHCKAVFLCGCLGLLLVMWVNVRFFFDVLELLVSAVRFSLNLLLLPFLGTTAWRALRVRTLGESLGTTAWRALRVRTLGESLGTTAWRALRLRTLGGSLVTTAWRVLRLRMEGTPSSFGW
jgi:hypothetical protein